MEIIKDARILNAIAKRYNFTFDKVYKYVVQYNNDLYFTDIIYKGNKYQLQFFSGCFYPYLVKEVSKQ